MLVLTRKVGETIVINDNIELTVLEAGGDFIKIGIEAPKEIKIFRKEIYLEIIQANKEAAIVTSTNTSSLLEFLKDEKF